MHWELWTLNVGNLIGGFETEAAALTVARDLISDGWSAEDLGLALEWDDDEEGDDALLPPARYGATLLERL
jgi:hypothetical protein